MEKPIRSMSDLVGYVWFNYTLNQSLKLPLSKLSSNQTKEEEELMF